MLPWTHNHYKRFYVLPNAAHSQARRSSSTSPNPQSASVLPHWKSSSIPNYLTALAGIFTLPKPVAHCCRKRSAFFKTSAKPADASTTFAAAYRAACRWASATTLGYTACRRYCGNSANDIQMSSWISTLWIQSRPTTASSTARWIWQ